MKYPKLSYLRLGDALYASKPYLWVITATPFLAAFIASRAELSWFFWLGLVYFTMPYNLLFHGLEKLDISSSKWLGAWLAITNLPLLTALLVLSSPPTRLWLLAAVLAAASYGLKAIRLKEVPILDSICWAFVVAGPLVVAQLESGWRSNFLPAAAALFSWAAATHVFETIQTVDRDKFIHIPTTASSLGARTSMLLSAGLYGVAAILPVLTYGGWGLVVAAVMSLYALNALRFFGVTNPELFSMGWRLLLKLNYPAAVVIIAVLLLAIK